MLDSINESDVIRKIDAVRHRDGTVSLALLRAQDTHGPGTVDIYRITEDGSVLQVERIGDARSVYGMALSWLGVYIALQYENGVEILRLDDGKSRFHHGCTLDAGGWFRHWQAIMAHDENNKTVLLNDDYRMAFSGLEPDGFVIDQQDGMSMSTGTTDEPWRIAHTLTDFADDRRTFPVLYHRPGGFDVRSYVRTDFGGHTRTLGEQLVFEDYSAVEVEDGEDIEVRTDGLSADEYALAALPYIGRSVSIPFFRTIADLNGLIFVDHISDIGLVVKVFQNDEVSLLWTEDSEVSDAVRATVESIVFLSGNAVEACSWTYVSHFHGGEDFGVSIVPDGHRDELPTVVYLPGGPIPDSGDFLSDPAKMCLDAGMSLFIPALSGTSHYGPEQDADLAAVSNPALGVNGHIATDARDKIAAVCGGAPLVLLGESFGAHAALALTLTEMEQEAPALNIRGVFVLSALIDPAHAMLSYPADRRTVEKFCVKYGDGAIMRPVLQLAYASLADYCEEHFAGRELADSPPIALYHGTADDRCPVSDARRFEQAYGYRAFMVPFNGLGHDIDTASEVSDMVIHDIETLVYSERAKA